MKVKRADLLLSVIAAAEGETVTPAQLQKVAFLVGKKFPDDVPGNYYRFKKYDYGPFCVDIYRDAEKLQCQGLVLVQVNPRGGWKEYSATQKGLATAANIESNSMTKYIVKKVKWARSVSFQELVREIYKKYPAYRENSVFQD